MASSRFFLRAAIGIVAAAIGYPLMLDLWDPGTIIIQGTRFGQNTQHYLFLGQLLLCTGVTMTPLSVMCWAARIGELRSQKGES